MLTTRVAIIGGGLSGLYAAALLEKRGIKDYVLFEARDTFGGRILSLPADSATERYDLGATWFWPTMNPDLAKLIELLGLETFEQFEAGDMLIENSRSRPPARVKGHPSTLPALRVAGGMGALTDAIRDCLIGRALISSHRVCKLRHLGDCIEVEAHDALGSTICYRVTHVLLAVPPRLAATTIEFTPMLQEATMKQWKHCGTWMAPHAKYVAVFDEPFWRQQGLSGEVRSAVGPLGEIHDASAHRDGAALFGFFGVPAQVRIRTPEAVLLEHCRAQLVRLFGDSAGAPWVEFLKDWTSDPYTAVLADQQPGAHHSVELPSTPSAGVWKDRLIGIASEWSPRFSGYIAGAVDAASLGIAKLQAADTTGTVSH
ncbi:amine oxidase [Ralstonia sp. A12]|uniref:flavin monoamine oxidase family protein n=1 Tax=Ralstonia sp. A12 TaxID=1217052 RepID=UPI00057355C6|nr:FAD-dependent oxidoreductase [Ralstonia sp. A12]KHK50943.1 amine oxidase [Ralstonia sp. A12]